MEKKKVIVSYNNLPPNVIEAIKIQYPEGYANYVKKIPKPNNDFFYAINVETEDTSYLVKVNVKIDNINPEKLEEQLFAADLSFKEDSKPADSQEGTDDIAQDESSVNDKEDI
jgi:hypothetical protein